MNYSFHKNLYVYISTIYISVLQQKIVKTVGLPRPRGISEEKDCNIINEENDLENICLCEKPSYNTTPIMSNVTCPILEFRNTSITTLSKDWFNETIYKSTHELSIKNSTFMFQDLKFLENFQHLSTLNIVNCTGSNLETPSWPSIKLVELRLKNLNISKFPNLNKKLPLKIINLNENRNIRVTYEKVVFFCNLKKFYANLLAGLNKQTSTETDFCDCMRLRVYFTKYFIQTNIVKCQFKKIKDKLSEYNCSFDFRFGHYQKTDPCGRKVFYFKTPPELLLGFTTTTTQSTLTFQPKAFAWLIPFSIIGALIVSTLVYQFFFSEKPENVETIDGNETIESKTV